MMIKFRESGHPVFRATSPLSRGTLKAKEVEYNQYTIAPKRERLKLFFAHLSLNQLSIYGAASDVWEEYSARQTRMERPVLAGQSDPLFASRLIDNVTHILD